MSSTDFVATAQHAAHSSMINAASSTSNVTASLPQLYSARNIALLPFRFLAKADRFLFRTLPRTLVRTTGLENLARRAVDLVRTGDAAVAAVAAAPEGVAQAAEATGGSWTDIFFEGFQAGTHKSYWGMLHYVTSRWAFTCFIMALIMNRISVYASSRQRIVLTWNKRLALRLIPIMLFISQMHQILQAIHCQTSPNFSLYRHGDNNKYTILDWSSDGGPLHTASSAMLFWSTDEQSCAAIGMSRPEPNIRAPFGSFSLLWPTFLRLSISHIVENLSSSLQQIPAMTEVGLSVFEHSLAFAEAETMVAHTLNKKPAKVTNATTATTSAAVAVITAEGTIPASGTILAITDAAQAFTGPHIFDRINVPVEILIVAFLSCGNSLAAHIIAVVGKKQKWRLANTAFWGICYMTAFSWGFLVESEMVRMDTGIPKPVSGLLHFPTVAIVGFLPHMAIIVGIMVCGLIYLVALLLTAVSLGTNPNLRRPTSLKERISIAHDNLQAAIQLKSINIRFYEDFYTALLRIGFAALTAASEAVFLNEGRAVEMRQFTWLEEERLDELDATGSMRPPAEAHFQIVEEYGIPRTNFEDQSHQDGEWKSGYENERKMEKKDKTLQDKDSYIYPNPRTDGVGALQRTTRFYLLFIFMRGIMFTISGWIAFGIGALLDRIGITARPEWLRRVIGRSQKQSAKDRDRMQVLEETKPFHHWTQHGGIAARSGNADIDIEHEMRTSVALEHHDNPQEALDQKMYDWWKSGGWYSTIDESGDYEPPVQSIEQDEDATSVITTTTTASSVTGDEQDAWESEAEGARTPTQQHRSHSWTFARLRQERSETPTPEPPILDNATLARLLNPPDQASRDEARILSSHLNSANGIMTRSRHRRQFESDRAKVLLAGRVPPTLDIWKSSSAATSSRRPLTNDEEAHALEQLLLNRRRQKQRHEHNVQQNHATSDLPESSAQASTGPSCVVCQTEPRTIIAWPCRCLTVCEDCRVNLAMNNFGTCVTCRRPVGGFVRLYVP